MTPPDVPTVFVIDDDDLVRASIQGLLKSEGLRSETFGTRCECRNGKRRTLAGMPAPQRQKVRKS